MITAKPRRYPFRYHPKNGIWMDVALRLSSLMQLNALANMRLVAFAILIGFVIFVFDFARPFEMVVRFLKNPKPVKVKERVERQRGWGLTKIQLAALIPPMERAA